MLKSRGGGEYTSFLCRSGYEGVQLSSESFPAIRPAQVVALNLFL